MKTSGWVEEILKDSKDLLTDVGIQISLSLKQWHF